MYWVVHPVTEILLEANANGLRALYDRPRMKLLDSGVETRLVEPQMRSKRHWNMSARKTTAMCSRRAKAPRGTLRASVHMVR